MADNKILGAAGVSLAGQLLLRKAAKSFSFPWFLSLLHDSFSSPPSFVSPLRPMADDRPQVRAGEGVVALACGRSSDSARARSSQPGQGSPSPDLAKFWEATVSGSGEVLGAAARVAYDL